MAKKELDVNTFYTVYKWMSQLQLAPAKESKKGKEKPLAGLCKEVYAIIYGFSGEDEEGSCYYSYSQFEEVTGASRRAVALALQTLEENSLITVYREKYKNAYVKTFYRINRDKLRGVLIKNY